MPDTWVLPQLSWLYEVIEILVMVLAWVPTVCHFGNSAHCPAGVAQSFSITVWLSLPININDDFRPTGLHL